MESRSQDLSGRPAVGASPPTSEWGLCNGMGLQAAVKGAATWLTLHAAEVNALNVFPVPDGDTGTNMSLTVESALKEAEASPLHGAGEIAIALSHGALMGARGNSGVILSQIIRGVARILEGRDSFDGIVLAQALQAATETAYRAVSKPVEGTILTVIRECGEAAAMAARQEPSLLFVLKEAVDAAWDSVQRTPDLLPVLKQAGVVDAGGQGLAVFLEGMYYHFTGELEQHVQGAEIPFPEEMAFIDVHGEEEFGYCTNFVMLGQDLPVEQVRDQISRLGRSTVVAGDEHMIKVHVHTEHPGTVLDYAVGLASLHQIEITNMDEQRAGLRPQPPAAAAVPPTVLPELKPHPTMIIAVSPGEGLDEVLCSVGAAATVAGGQTMNPSAEELFQTIQSLPCNEIIVLPNNSNVTMTARQAAALSSKDVRVVPTETIPQGIAALVAFNYEADLDRNVAAMEEAAASVQTAEITRAIRDASLNGIQVKEGQVIGLLNGVLEAAGESEQEVIDDILHRMGAAELELISLYYGEDITAEQAEEMAARIQDGYPDQEVELVYGGQPYYCYILSAE